MMIYLAEAGSGISPEAVGVIIGSILTALIGGGFVGKKITERSQGVKVENTPLDVRMREEFVTRREFEKLEGRLEVYAADTKGLFREAVVRMEAQFDLVIKKLDGQNERLTKKIEDVASGAYQSRGKIHQTLNATREELKELKSACNVSEQIGKLAESLNQPRPAIQPVHVTHHQP